jgi:hypothetical protein
VREPADTSMAIEPGADGAGRVRASFTFAGERRFYGLGHGGGRLDRLGQGRQLWNSHLGHGPGSDIAIPLLVANRGSSDSRLTGPRPCGGELMLRVALPLPSVSLLEIRAAPWRHSTGGPGARAR